MKDNDVRVEINTVQQLSRVCDEEKYLCAEFGEGFFIQVGLFINSGFVPKLRTRGKNMLRTVPCTAKLY